jgi:hypothetical protein
MSPLFQGLEWLDEKDPSFARALVTEDSQRHCPQEDRQPHCPSTARASLLFHGLLEEVEGREATANKFAFGSMSYPVQWRQVFEQGNPPLSEDRWEDESSTGVPSSVKSMSVASCRSSHMAGAGIMQCDRRMNFSARSALITNAFDERQRLNMRPAPTSLADNSPFIMDDVSMACPFAFGTSVEIIGAYPSGEKGKVVAVDCSQGKVKVRLKHRFGIRMYHTANVRPVTGHP